MTEKDLRIVVVTFQVGAFAAAYAEESSLPWPLLVDEERRLYAAYGMERGPWRHILGLTTLVAYARLLLRRRLPKKTDGDVRQLGGDVLIDPKGIVRWHHVSKGPADRPSVGRLMALVADR